MYLLPDGMVHTYGPDRNPGEPRRSAPQKGPCPVNDLVGVVRGGGSGGDLEAYEASREAAGEADVGDVGGVAVIARPAGHESARARSLVTS